MAETNEMILTLQDLTARLRELGIEYMVTGSFAMSVYATARTTLDIDVVLEIAKPDVKRFAEAFEGDYYVDPVSISRAVDHRSMFNVINNSTFVKIDCIVIKQDPNEAFKFSRRRLATIGGVDFWVISKEDLVISKLQWARATHSELQFRDVRNLIESGVDDSAISDSVEKLGLNQTWEAFVQWKTQAEK